MDKFDRITQSPDIMDGKPCIRGIRVTVSMIVNQIAAGRAAEDVLRDYPYLEQEDIEQALGYAARLVEVSGKCSGATPENMYDVFRRHFEPTGAVDLEVPPRSKTIRTPNFED